MSMLAPPDPATRAITWRIEWDGKSYRWDDLTVGHLALLQGLVGSDEWATLSPWTIDPNSGYMMAAYLLTVFLAADRCADVTDEESAAEVMAQVLAEVRGITAGQLADAVHDV
jgi:hypothetical protein